jgi:cytochrome P450
MTSVGDNCASAGSSSSVVRDLARLPSPVGIPLFGNLLQIDSLRFHRQMEDWAGEFGPFYRLKLGRKSVLVLSDSTAMAKLMRERPDVIRRSTRTATALNELGGRGVFTAEGDDWRAQRKLVMRALTPEVIRNFFPTLVMMTERMRQRWLTMTREGRPVNLLHDLRAFALDVIVHLAMGQDINTLEQADNQIQRDIEFLFNRIARRITSPIPYWRYFRLAPDKEADACKERINKAVTGFIEEARRQLNEQPHLREKPANMLQALLVARDEPNSGFDDGHVIGNAVTMVFAGEDTTSNTIAWLLYHLTQNSSAAAKLQSEVDIELGAERVLAQFDRLDQFAYLDAATNEAMRLTPVAPFMSLEPNVDIQVGDVAVPKGTLMLLLLRQSSRLAGTWSEPSVFQPERWIASAGFATDGDPSRKMFPFGAGPRFCPGRYLALAEIRMVVSMLARTFTLEFDTKAPAVEEFFTYTMTPSSLPVRLVER